MATFLFKKCKRTPLFVIYILLLLIFGSASEWTLIEEEACFSASAVLHNYTFHASHTGTVNAIKLRHSRGGVRCDPNFPYSNWGCGATPLVYLVEHYADATVHAVLPTNDTTLSSPLDTMPSSGYFYFPWNACDNLGNDCNSWGYSSSVQDANSSILVWSNFTSNVHVHTNDTFSLQYSEACCNATVGNNDGLSCAEIYFQYDPTPSPSNTPSQSPTATSESPTSNPNFNPTTEPITEPTNAPMTPDSTPTKSPSISPPSPIVSQRLYGYVVIGFLGFSALVVASSYIDAQSIRGNDFYSASALVSAAFQILDLISDLFFCAEMLSLSHDFIHLAIVSAAFIVIPSILSLAQLYHAVRRWRSIGNDMLTAWLFNYAFGLYVLSLLTGNAFSGLQICRSDMFGLPQFAMPLNHNQTIEFQSKKLWSIVMLEVEYNLLFGIPSELLMTVHT